MNVTRETLNNLSKAIQIQEAESKLSKLVNTRFKTTYTKYKDGNFVINLCENGNSNHSYILAGNSHLYNPTIPLNEITLSKEDEEEIRELILTKFSKAVQQRTDKWKKALKDEIVTI